MFIFFARRGCPFIRNLTQPNAVGLALAVLASTVSAGSGSKPEPAPGLETVVVTAHRTPVVASAVGSAVSRIDRDLIEARQVAFATDLLRDLPSVAVSRAGGFGAQTQVRVRGSEGNHVLVVIDGVEANDPAGPDEFDFAALTSFDIESIELVRGPQSALWGSDATAGILHVTTRDGAGPLAASAFLEAGSFETVNTGARFSAGGDNGSVSVGISRLDSAGTKTAASGTENDGVENTTASLNARWQLGKRISTRFFARYTQARTEFDDFDFTTGLPADADRESDDQLLLLSASARMSLADERWTHEVRLTYLDSHHDLREDGLEAGSTAAEKLGAYYQSTLRTADDTHRLVVALDHEEEKFRQRGMAFAFGDPNQDQRLQTTGYVAEYLARPTHGWSVSASARFDDNSDFDDVTTYRLTSAYHWAQTGTRVRASYGTGQKSPTFIERFGFFPDQFVGNPDLDPERSRGFEFALAQQFAEGRWNAEVGYFDERLKDEIDGFVFDPTTLSFTAQNLIGTSKRTGFELQVSGSINNQLNARAAYTYTDSTQPDALGAQTREVRRPKHMAALNLNYAVSKRRLNLNLNVSYTSLQTDQFFPPPLFTPQTVRLSDYTLVDLTARFALSPRISAYARMENLTDERYSDVFGFAAPGRGAYAGIHLSL